jgi:hypothetical protein
MVEHKRTIGIALAVGLAACTTTSASDIKNARCSTTDDGEYDCQFRTIDDAGSFEISAPDKPKYTVNIDQPGVAYGFIDLGTGNVPLPGKYLRSESDPACWENDTTNTSICAR